MSEVRAVPDGGVARGTLRVPPSKSVSHRQLNLALLGGQRTRVRHPLEAEDIVHFRGALEVLGYRVEPGEGTLNLKPPAERSTEGTIYCGNAGTLFRFLTATLTTIPGRWVLDGTARMRERPIGPLVEGLRGLGAVIDYVGVSGYPPLAITGGSLQGGSTRLDAGASSQYLSAVLMAALVAPRPSRIEVTALTSPPYVEITRRLIGQWGGSVSTAGAIWEVEPGLTPAAEVEVEGDYSAAPYPAGAAVLTGGQVRLQGLLRDSAQGDREFMDLLSTMGASVVWEGAELVVAAGEDLVAPDVDLSAMPDQVPTLAALAPFARGTTVIRNVPHLRIKECDRLAAMASQLQRLGVPVVEHAAGLEIEGVWHDREPPSDEVVVDTYDDHRIAMTLALVGLRRPGVVVSEPGVVGKSYPGFWNDLDRLLS